MMDCLFGALANVVPEKVAADGCGGASLNTFAGYRGSAAFVFNDVLMGSWGGTAPHDGQEGVPHMGANQSNIPIETIEIDFPLRIEHYGLVANSGGPGKHRGGLALIREYRALEDNVLLSVRSDKRDHPPHGLAGGSPGGPSWNIVNPGQNQRILPVLFARPDNLDEGDLFSHIKAGGGGYGDPKEREAEAVLADVIAEKVTPDHAAEAYGVIVVGNVDDGFSIDQAATTLRRQAMEQETSQ